MTIQRTLSLLGKDFNEITEEQFNLGTPNNGDMVVRIEEIKHYFRPKNPTKYKTLYIDPPWNEQGGGKIKRGADRHYPLMKTNDIIELLKKEILPQADEDCHLYLWVTNNFLKDGLRVIEELGFRYVTCITWTKDRIGLGQYFRGMTEQCLFAVRGKVPYKILDGKRQQGVTGFSESKQEHSKKPTTMREMIEKVSYAPFLEVFARKRQEEWDYWGNEIRGETNGN